MPDGNDPSDSKSMFSFIKSHRSDLTNAISIFVSICATVAAVILSTSKGSNGESDLLLYAWSSGALLLGFLIFQSAQAFQISKLSREYDVSSSMVLDSQNNINRYKYISLAAEERIRHIMKVSTDFDMEMMSAFRDARLGVSRDILMDRIDSQTYAYLDRVCNLAVDTVAAKKDLDRKQFLSKIRFIKSEPGAPAGYFSAAQSDTQPFTRDLAKDNYRRVVDNIIYYWLSDPKYKHRHVNSSLTVILKEMEYPPFAGKFSRPTRKDNYNIIVLPIYGEKFSSSGIVSDRIPLSPQYYSENDCLIGFLALYSNIAEFDPDSELGLLRQIAYSIFSSIRLRSITLEYINDMFHSEIHGK